MDKTLILLSKKEDYNKKIKNYNLKISINKEKISKYNNLNKNKYDKKNIKLLSKEVKKMESLLKKNKNKLIIINKKLI